MRSLLAFAIFVLLGLASCKKCKECCTPNERIDPTDPNYNAFCKAPEVEKNIIGSWKFEAHGMGLTPVTTGYITFDAMRRMIDPDSLVENYIDFTVENPPNGGGPIVLKRPVIAKEYKISGKLVDFLLFYRHPDQGKTYAGGWNFVATENLCNRIVLTHPQTNFQHIRVILTR